MSWRAKTITAVAMFLVLPLIAACGRSEAPSDAEKAVDGDGGIKVLSNRPDLISGGDALVEVGLPAGIDPAQVRLDLDGRDVTDVFARRANGRYQGLVTGLAEGPNLLSARLPDGRSVRLTITNHPIGGPIFSGPQIQPWFCLPDALDAQCNRPIAYDWQYKSSATGKFAAYDPQNPPSDVASTTTDEGKTVPFIVRRESGTMDRNTYLIAVLADPAAEPFDRWTGPPVWNHKVYMTHGGGCGEGRTEKPGPDVMMALPLGKGYAVMSTALEHNQLNCNMVVQAESVMMAKEHLIEAYGDIRYLFGMGGSGGSMAQLYIASTYPGIYDGIIAAATFPDVPYNDTLDCTALIRYFDDPRKWGTGVVWTEQQAADASGIAAMSICEAWNRIGPTGYANTFDPRIGTGCDLDAAQRYNPDTNPTAQRCSLQDYMINVFGPRPPERWGPIEQQIGRGFAGRPYDNVGVQYGLRALMAGKISPAQFADLNAKIGAVDIDFGTQAQRVDVDPHVLAMAYSAGIVDEATFLDRVPIIDIPGFAPADNYEIHDIYKSWALRQRLDAAHGRHDNHVIWYGPNENGQINRDQAGPETLDTMDRWLAAVEADTRDVPLADKVADNRPGGVEDRCDFPDRGNCHEVFGPAGNVRHGAGMADLRNDIVKCHLKPLARADYAPLTFTDAQWQQLQSAFPDGVCDWDRPGVGQQPTQPWTDYTDGPGGRPLPPPPTAQSF